jgi:hypothetical protein
MKVNYFCQNVYSINRKKQNGLDLHAINRYVDNPHLK